MDQFITIMIDLCFLLILLSALLAGAFVFYHMVYKNKSFWEVDNFAFDLLDQNSKEFKEIKDRLEAIENNSKKQNDYIRSITNNINNG